MIVFKAIVLMGFLFEEELLPKNKKNLLIMDKRQPKCFSSLVLFYISVRETFIYKNDTYINRCRSKCFHNGIILIVN